MEALVAVGLAGNVVQFALCVGTLVKEAKSIKQHGSTDAIPALRASTEALIGQSHALRIRLTASMATPAEEDQYLLDLAEKCEASGNQFLAFLEETLPIGQSNTYQATKAAVKVKMKWNRIEDFVSNLERLQSALALATILACRKNAESNHEKVLTHLCDMRSENEAIGRSNSTLQDSIQTLSSLIDHQGEESRKLVKSQMRSCIDAIHLRRPGLYATEHEICTWLDFRQITWRFDSVNTAYRHTFEWIFKAPSGHKRWDDLEDYLKSDDNGPYFINGKAGSGKSTLMKYILKHERTKTALEVWNSADTELIFLHFFFWNSGTLLQKSHIGMLRALLHAVLTKHPELIPTVFPAVYRGCNNSRVEAEPQYIELKRALALLLQKATFLRLAIFIDGVDELDGDHHDISLFLRHLASDPKVKMVISSRPINACLDVFRNCPSLRLQDLTREDMKHFIQGELSSHGGMVALAQEFPDQRTSLEAIILEKASGVFLWVVLVVRLLVDRLRDGDTFDELYETLGALHSDIKVLYEQMFNALKPEYQTEAAQLLQLARLWDEIFEAPIPSLTLSFAMGQQFQTLAASNIAASRAAIDLTLLRFAKRIRSRCVGLLEFTRLDSWDTPYVDYHHRSVAEFLDQDSIWTYIRGKSQGSIFDPHRSLVSACISTMITAEFTGEIFKLEEFFFKLTDICRHASHFEKDDISGYLTEANDAMQIYQANSRYHWSLGLYGAVGPELIRDYLDINTFAASQALLYYSPEEVAKFDSNKRIAIIASMLGNYVPTRYLTRSGQERHVGHAGHDPLAYHLQHTMPQNIFSIEEWFTWSILWDYMATSAELLYAILATAVEPQLVWRSITREGEKRAQRLPDRWRSLENDLHELPNSDHLVDIMAKIGHLIKYGEAKSLLCVVITEASLEKKAKYHHKTILESSCETTGRVSETSHPNSAVGVATNPVQPSPATSSRFHVEDRMYPRILLSMPNGKSVLL
ncbi:hypothetical protein BKA63DRAFT_518337 [Paraphoma chrysanthemicola]|nr:hypothetical protein BKA63DRAFT_518337 [Paraphoma chrysanthemicola]